MRDYEIVYIFRSSLTSEEIEAKLERYHAIITKDGPGDIAGVLHWGKRQLAYPIKKQPNGYYVVAQFTSGPDRLKELERVLKLEDDVLRYLIVIAELPLPIPDPTPEAPAAEAPAAEEAKAGEAADAQAAADGAEGEPSESEAGAEAGSEAADEPEAGAPADDADAEEPADGKEE